MRAWRGAPFRAEAPREAAKTYLGAEKRVVVVAGTQKHVSEPIPEIDKVIDGVVSADGVVTMAAKRVDGTCFLVRVRLGAAEILKKDVDGASAAISPNARYVALAAFVPVDGIEIKSCVVRTLGDSLEIGEPVFVQPACESVVRFDIDCAAGIAALATKRTEGLVDRYFFHVSRREGGAWSIVRAFVAPDDILGIYVGDGRVYGLFRKCDIFVPLEGYRVVHLGPGAGARDEIKYGPVPDDARLCAALRPA